MIISLFLENPENPELKAQVMMSILEEQDRKERVKRSKRQKEVEDFVSEVAQGTASRPQKLRLLAKMFGVQQNDSQPLSEEQLEIIDRLLDNP